MKSLSFQSFPLSTSVKGKLSRGRRGFLLRHKRLYFRLILVVSTFFVLGLILFSSSLFRVKHIEVIWDNVDFLNPEASSAAGKKFLGRNIFLSSPENLASLVKELPEVREASFQKNLPDRLKIILKARSSFLQIIDLPYPLNQNLKEASLEALLKKELTKDSSLKIGKTWVIDETAWVFAQTSRILSLPKIFILGADDKPRVGSFLGQSVLWEDFLFYKNFSQKSDSYRISSFLATQFPYIIAKLDGETLLLLNFESSYSGVTEILNSILNKYFIEGKHLKKIDLRFKNPVVEY